MKTFKEILLVLSLFLFIGSFESEANEASTQENSGQLGVFSSPKREFRGAWIQCVNGQFQGMGTQAMQADLTNHLDVLQRDGINVIIFQVRPECDALYNSPYEPWSKFLTGVQGQAPNPYWDPLEWMVRECHKRGMELHAWINPYRAKTKTTTVLADSHIAKRAPQLAFEYDDLLILDPGIPENRVYICNIVKDIVSHYDVDGLHIDDYFYPYPVAGLEIPDQATFQKYSRGFTNIRDWRRDNVNLFIKELGEAVHKTKPWVKFGVSPFGIYRNKKEDPDGSNTNGLTNYDGLYADVLLWVKNGWVDYNVPQIYWQIGHPTADYKELITWWNSHAPNRPLIIGEDVERTVKYADLSNPNMNQQYAKMQLERSLPNVQGSCQWYSRVVVNDLGQYGTNLRNVYFKTPSLQPEMKWLSKKAPKAPRKLKVIWMEDDGLVLFWTAPKASKDWATRATEYLVYKFEKGEKIDVTNFSHLVGKTTNTFWRLPYKDGTKKHVYVVTALNRIHNESQPAKKVVKY
ncbi:MAG: family 10 glycosylhydrolase [Bacteroidaceae bacterium]|nr:family 10 glycosylhydrolase [Bacteroidaceae bacterium]